MSVSGRGTVLMLVDFGNHLGSCGQRPILEADIKLKMCSKHRCIYDKQTQLEVSVGVSGKLCSRACDKGDGQWQSWDCLPGAMQIAGPM